MLMNVTSLTFVMAMLPVMTLKVALCAYAEMATLEMDFHAQVSLYYWVIWYFLHQSVIDIDECSTGEVCDKNAECVDTAGSYECTCSSGYTGDGHTCLDIDECLSDPCDENATCTNNNGSFSCHCHTGFVGNGKNCTRKFMLIFKYSLLTAILPRHDLFCT